MLVQDTTSGHEWRRLEKNFSAQVKILPLETKLTTNLVITPQRVLIHQLTAPIVGIIIENKNVINMHREMYEIIWNSVQE